MQKWRPPLVSLIATALLLVPASAAEPLPRKHSNLARLALERLAATHADVLKLQAQRRALPPLPGLTDFRCIFHAHAEDSTHTGGTLPEMLADAKKAGVRAIFLSDHFRPPRDFITGGWRGLKEGVLFVPGSEVRGFLVHPEKSILDRMDLMDGDFIDTVTSGSGLIFLSHIEERRKYPLDRLTGLEIYNRHWDAKRDPASLLALALMLTDPKQVADLKKALKLYPDEVLAFQCDYPGVYLEKWDDGTQRRRLTGVAANDCHHNQILLVKMVDANTVRVGTNVDADDKMRTLTATLRPGIREMTQGRKPGDVLVRLDVDPYVRSFRNLSTHILAEKLDEPTLRAALKAGHAYVAHDWMCDPTGFRFEAVDAEGRSLGVMGDEVKRGDGLKLTARLPVPALVRLIHQGKEIARTEGKATFEQAVTEPGAYRLEAWLKLDDEWRPWIYSNPIYVR